MGGLCSCCFGGPKETEEDRAKMTEAQNKAGLAAQQSHLHGTKIGTKIPSPGKPTPLRNFAKAKETEEDRAKTTEAKTKAGLAAQQRQEAFEKSAAGRAAKKVAAEAAKPLPPPNRGEAGLRWQIG